MQPTQLRLTRRHLRNVSIIRVSRLHPCVNPVWTLLMHHFFKKFFLVDQLKIEGYFGFRTFWTKFCNILKYGVNLKFETSVQIFRKIIQLNAVIVLKSPNEYYRKIISKSGPKMDLYPAMHIHMSYFGATGTPVLDFHLDFFFGLCGIDPRILLCGSSEFQTWNQPIMSAAR